MTSALQTGPNTGYDFGYDFNYASWPNHTKLTLLNVTWNNDYRDIVRKDSQADLDDWIDAQPNLIIENASLQKFNTDVMINTPVNRAMQYNYLRAQNGTSGVGDSVRNYYYFITDVNFVAGNTTRLSLQLDVWSTFGYEIQFGNCYIERGHIGIANTNGFDHYGRDYLTVPEGMDTGGEYRVVHAENQQLMSTTAPSNDPLAFDILICSTLDLTQDPGTVNNPAIKSASGSNFQGMPSGANFYLFRNQSQFSAFLALYADKPWITQSIISVTLIPSMSRYVPGYNYGTNIFPGGDPLNLGLGMYAAGSDVPVPKVTAMLSGWRGATFIATVLGARYAGLKKFLTYPYMLLELTTWSSSPIIIKPESWQDANATVREIAAFLPPGQRIAISPYRYNSDSSFTDPAGVDDGGENLDMATFLDNFPTLPIVNNMAINYLASNKNGLAFQFNAADWAQQRALAGAQAGANVANAGIANTGNQAAIANRAANAQNTNTNLGTMANSAITSAQGMLMGGANGLAGGSVVGGVMGALNADASALANFNHAIVGVNVNNQATSIGVNARNAGTSSDITAASSVRDTNQQYANFAAQGDYATQVNGINAKIQDTRMLQPSTSGQFGGDAFNIINNIFGYSLRWKMLNVNALRSIGNFWLRYGYAIQQFGQVPADFMVMSKFTYWKLTETYITQGPFPEQFKQTIRGIFEKGVTVWREPEYIGTTDIADNTPIAGVTL